MNIPFSFGKIVREDDFTDRAQETAVKVEKFSAADSPTIILIWILFLFLLLS